MNYEVTLSPRARHDLETAYQWLLERTPLHAGRWHDQLIDAMVSLQEYPERCPLVQGTSKFPPGTRQLLFGDKHHAYRVLFVIRGQSVWIAHIRHAARRL